MVGYSIPIQKVETIVETIAEVLVSVSQSVILGIPRSLSLRSLSIHIAYERT